MGSVQVHDVTTPRDITGRNTVLNSRTQHQRRYTAIYRKVVAEMMDVLEEREVERFLRVCTVDRENANVGDVVMMVCFRYNV